MTTSHLAKFLQSNEGQSVSRETIDSWRLLKAFVQLSTAQRREVLEFVERCLQR